VCGIAGIWNLDGAPVIPAELDRFTDSLAHRGPDGRGTYLDPQGGFGLGHRRLAILDLSPGGHQPMSSADGRYWISFNGEIYNFIELRGELEAKGHRFRTDSDTEVILAAYAEWGSDCQLRFNGMWGFAIWDQQERTLFVSRDRFGVKPLHYVWEDRRFAFASEMKAFLCLEDFAAEFDLPLLAYVVDGGVHIEGTESCLLHQVKRLRGGHCLFLRQGGEPRINRWWNTLDHLETVPRRFADQVGRYHELFFDACRLRMRSDVPIGTALSGGLDSSSVLCAMAQIKAGTGGGERLASAWQRAFVATYPGTPQDERAYAEQVADFVGIAPSYHTIDPAQGVANLDNFLFQFEEIQDFHLGPWLVYREMSRSGIKVSMDGHGGDETLAGYHHYPRAALREAVWPWPNLRRWADLQTTLQEMYPAGAAPPAPSLANVLGAELTPLRRRLRQRVLSLPLVRPALKSVFGAWRTPPDPATGWLRISTCPPPAPELPADRRRAGQLGALGERLYRDFHLTILPTILRNFDRLSMAHGVEIRAPFMDWRLVCYAFSLPSASKLGGGYTKRILREAMKGVLPEPIRTRRSKIGFATPIEHWLRDELRPIVLDSVHSRPFLESAVWNGPALRDMVIAAYAAGDMNRLQLVWRYLQAMRLMELFASRRSSQVQ